MDADEALADGIACNPGQPPIHLVLSWLTADGKNNLHRVVEEEAGRLAGL